MLKIVPHYYSKFKCIADKCKHSCCCGWEIDIDPYSLFMYKNTEGDIGKRLAENISVNGTPHFILKKDGRCPFLNQQGLCDLILDVGEHYLCDICHFHPRFINEFSHHTEMGIGMCCEAAAELILSQNEPLRLVDITGKQLNKITGNGWEFELFNKRSEFIKVVFDAPSISSMRNTLFLMVGLEPFEVPLSDMVNILLSTEIMDQAWKEMLLRVKDGSEKCEKQQFPKQVMQNIVAYFLYRYVSKAQDELELEDNLVFSVISADFIADICAYNNNFDYICDVCRMYSAEIEYSTENIGFIMEKLYEIE